MVECIFNKKFKCPVQDEDSGYITSIRDMTFTELLENVCAICPWRESYEVIKEIVRPQDRAR